MIVITIALSFLIIAISMAWLCLGLAGRQTGGCKCRNSGNCAGSGETCGLRRERKT
jgi:hypothetical protein